MTLQNNYEKLVYCVILASACIASASCAPEVEFSVKRLPEMDCLQTSYEAVRNGTQAFADEDHLIWNDLERPLGLKNEALFPS